MYRGDSDFPSGESDSHRGDSDFPSGESDLYSRESGFPSASPLADQRAMNSSRGVIEQTLSHSDLVMLQAARVVERGHAGGTPAVPGKASSRTKCLACPELSPAGAAECSPGRQPGVWEHKKISPSPEGATDGQGARAPHQGEGLRARAQGRFRRPVVRGRDQRPVCRRSARPQHPPPGPTLPSGPDP